MTSPSITEIMTADPTTIERSDPISQAYDLLNRAPFHHLIVGRRPTATLIPSW